MHQSSSSIFNPTKLIEANITHWRDNHELKLSFYSIHLEIPQGNHLQILIFTGDSYRAFVSARISYRTDKTTCKSQRTRTCACTRKNKQISSKSADDLGIYSIRNRNKNNGPDFEQTVCIYC